MSNNAKPAEKMSKSDAEFFKTIESQYKFMQKHFHEIDITPSKSKFEQNKATK